MGREIAFGEGDEKSVTTIITIHVCFDHYIFTYDFICIASLRLGQERSFGSRSVHLRNESC